MRDTKEVFEDPTGRLLLSRMAVSGIGERRGVDCREFACRNPSGSARAAKHDPVLAAWKFAVTGDKVLLHQMAGSSG